MEIWELLLIAVGLSMDAFAVAVCRGMLMRQASIKKALIIGLYFGIFQAGMPVLGYLIGSRFSLTVTSFDHWVAFLLLAYIGIRMIRGSFKKEGCPDRECPEGTCEDRQCPNGKRPVTKELPLTPLEMIPLAIATSIDAMAIGISFAFLEVKLLPAVSLIGAITLILSMAGVKIGNMFGNKFKAIAERAGGAILVLLGIKILLEHTGIIGI